jgi:hypothetical protein
MVIYKIIELQNIMSRMKTNLHTILNDYPSDTNDRTALALTEGNFVTV